MTYTEKLRKINELKTLLKRIDQKYTRSIANSTDQKTRRDLLALRTKNGAAISLCNELQFKYTNKLIKAEAAQLRRTARRSGSTKTREEQIKEANVFLHAFSSVI